MEVLIPIIGVLGDLYKILITIRNTLVRLSRKFLEIPESIMIDQPNTAKSEEQSQTIILMTFLNQIFLILIRLLFSFQIEEKKLFLDFVY